MPTVELHLFGPPRILSDGRPVMIGLKRATALLAYMAVTGRPQARERIATLLWTDEDERTARGRLRRTLFDLNRQVGRPLLTGDGGVLALAAGALETDIAAFRVAADVGGTEALERAANIPIDEFLAGFAIENAPGFMDWLAFTRETLRQELGAVLGRLAEQLAQAGRADRAIGYLQRQLALDPLQEPVHCRLIQVLAEAGQPAAALRQYELLQRLLDEELGVAPHPETVAAFRAISGQPALSSPAAHDAGGNAVPETRYTRSGSVLLAHQVFGDGALDLVFVPGFVSHLEIGWRDADLAAFFRALGTMARVTLLDRRGLGLSERLAEVDGPETLQEDLEAVMNAAGIRRAVLMGCSEAGPSCAQFAVRRPERVCGLILYGSMAKGTQSPDFRPALTSEQFDAWIDRLVAGWGGAPSIEAFAPSRSHDGRLRRWFADLLRQGVTPAGLRGVMTAFRDTDVRPLLAGLRTPTLVLHRAGDRAVRVEAGRDLAGRIPGARMVELPGDDHWWWIGDPAPMLDAIGDFLATVAGGRSRTATLSLAAARLVAVLALIPRIGNLGADAAAVTAAVTRHGGDVRSGPEGSMLALFNSFAEARAAAEEVARVSGFRIGLEVGDCSETGGHPTGRAVDLALAAARRGNGVALGEAAQTLLR